MNKPTPSGPDRRVSRTRAALSQALFELLQVRSWDKITVQQIIEQANVGRSTFYAHFETKFDLLVAQLPSMGVPLVAAEDGAIPDFVPLFEHVRDRADAMAPILAQTIRGEITDQMQHRLTEVWISILAGRSAEINNEFTARFLAGATLSAMRYYLQDTSMGTPEEMAAKLSLIVGRVLAHEPA